MFKKNKTKFFLLFLFISVLIAKVILLLQMSGTFMYSDEACMIIKARHFAENFQIDKCQEISGAPAGEPMPFYSIVISPAYWFGNLGMTSYYLVLFINALLVSTLVFPLFFFFNKLAKIKSKKLISFLTFLILFMAPLSLYEKMVATESLFVVSNIWLIYFYIKSFEKKHALRNKFLAIFFAILSALTRPFGFISLIALTINEIFQAKNKKLLFFMIPGAVVLTIFAFISVGLDLTFFKVLLDFFNPKRLVLIIAAIKNQINSFIIATALIPILIFLSNIFTTKIKEISKIKVFLISYLFMNFGIAANHLYGYSVKGRPLTLLTRYINFPVILITIFAFIFIYRNKKTIINKITIAASFLTLIPLFFLDYTEAKHALNLILSNFYDTKQFFPHNIPMTKDGMIFFFLPFIFILFIFYISKKKKIVTHLLIGFLIFHSVVINLWIVDFSKGKQNDVNYQNLKDKEAKILYLTKYSSKVTSYNFWRLTALSKNELTPMYQLDLRHYILYEDFNNPDFIEFIKDYDYVISSTRLQLEPAFNVANGLEVIYKTP